MLHIYEIRFINFMIEVNNMILIMIYCNPLHIQINCVSKTYITLILPRLSEIGYWDILTKILYEFFLSYGQIPNNFIPAYMCIYEFIASAFFMPPDNAIVHGFVNIIMSGEEACNLWSCW